MYFWIARLDEKKMKVEVTQSCPTLCDPMHYMVDEFSSQNTGVGSLSLLQWIFPTQGSNPGLPHCRWILYQLSHKGSPRILEWVAFPFSSVYSQPRNWTGFSCIAGRFFTSWATREAQILEWVSLSLLQQIFPTQESTRGLLHCRRILY